MIGLDAAGKTTILYRIKEQDIKTKIPTIGSCYEEGQYKNFNLKVMDIGGSAKI